MLVVAATGGLALLAMLFIDIRMELQMRPRIYRRPEDVPAHDVAIVLGARVYSKGRLSAMLEDRVISAVDLYKAGKVKKLLMSGDNSSEYYDEVSAMRDVAIKLGVPSNDVVRDFAGFRTYDTMYRAKELWGITSATVVTQNFHLPRSLYLARTRGIEADGLIADRRRYRTTLYSRFREYFARSAAWLDVNVLKPKPHFLGRKEELSGDKQEIEQEKKGKR